MVIFCKKWKKYNEIQLTKNKMDLNIRKMTNHPPSPAIVHKLNSFLNKRLHTLLQHIVHKLKSFLNKSLHKLLTKQELVSKQNRAARRCVMWTASHA